MKIYVTLIPYIRLDAQNLKLCGIADLAASFVSDPVFA